MARTVVKAAAVIEVRPGGDHVHCLCLVTRRDPSRGIPAVSHASFKVSRVDTMPTDAERVLGGIHGCIRRSVRTTRRRDIEVIAATVRIGTRTQHAQGLIGQCSGWPRI